MVEQVVADRTGHQARLQEDFTAGLRCIRNADYAGALAVFRALDEGSCFDDEFQNRYTSFHGLARVMTGDATGVKLCRKAAVGNAGDAAVLCNLARAEHRLDHRESAYLALRRGLRIDPAHHDLLSLKREIVLRGKRGFIPLLSREHALNRWIGRLVRGIRQPRAD